MSYIIYRIHPHISTRFRGSSRRWSRALVRKSPAHPASLCDLVQYIDLFRVSSILKSIICSAFLPAVSGQCQRCICPTLWLFIRISDGQQELWGTAKKRQNRQKGSRCTLCHHQQYQPCIYQQLYSLPAASDAIPYHPKLSYPLSATAYSCRSIVAKTHTGHFHQYRKIAGITNEF